MYDPDHSKCNLRQPDDRRDHSPYHNRAPTPAEAQQIAAAAYVFGYPLIKMDITKDQMTAVPAPTSNGMAAPINQFGNAPNSPDALFKTVVSPNADTLYSTAWLNLSKESIVLSVPNTNGRYYLMPMLDAWTNVFASQGSAPPEPARATSPLSAQGGTVHSLLD